jgi:uncharacterized protein YndB with AHSA1/START domain
MWTRDVTAVGAAPPEALWGLLVDPAAWPRWDGAVQEVVTGPGPLEPGKRVRILTRTGAAVRLRVLTVEPGIEYADRQSIPLGRVVVRRMLAAEVAEAAGTRVTFRLEIRGPFGGPWGRLLGRRLAEALGDALLGLVAAAERGAA